MVLSRLTKITGPGVATDTNWVGNNADFTGITTTATSFNIGVTTIHSTLIESHNIVSTGVITATGGSFSGNVTAVDGTFTGNVSIAGTLTYEDVTNVDSVGIVTAAAVDVDDFLDVGSNIKLGNAGVITATSFVGSGSNLTGITQTTINNNANNRLITGSGTANTLEAEGGLTFDGNNFEVTATSGTIKINSTGPGIHFIDTNADSDYMIQADGGIFKLVDLTNSSAIRLQVASNGNVAIAKDLDVDGHTNLDNVSIAGVTTMSGNLTISNTAPVLKLVDTDSNSDFSIYGSQGVFNIYDETNSASRLTIASDGTITAVQGLVCSSTLTIPDSIIHSGDTNTKIRFPEADAVTIETNGSERFRINSSGAWGIGAAYGSSGQVLTSGGSGSSPSWTTITGTTINNNANNRLITGSGTANTLEGEANLTFDGDNLLIKSSTDGRRISFAGDGTSHYMKYDNTLGGIILNGYGGIAFETYGTNERIRIASNGGVGIATDKIPRNYFLHIAAPSQDFTNSSTQLMDGGGICLQTTDTLPSTGRNYPGIFWSGNTAALGRARAGIIGVAASNNDATNIVFLTRTAANGTPLTPVDERMRIDNSGRVLIGTTTPGTGSGDDLTISNTSNMGLTLRSTSSNYCNIYFSDANSGTATYEGYISYNHATDSLEFATVHTERLRIHSDGQIQAGTSNPTYLKYTGSAVPTNNNCGTLLGSNNIGLIGQYSSLNMPFDHSTATASGAWWMLGRSAGTTNEWGLYTRSGGQSNLLSVWKVIGNSNGTTNYQTFSTGSNSERLRITSGGILQQSATGGDNQFVSTRTGTTYNDGDYYFQLFAKNNSSTTMGALGIVRDTGNTNSRMTFYTADGGTNKERARINRWGGLQLRNIIPPYGSSEPASRYIYSYHRSGTYNTFWAEIRFATPGSYCLDLRMGGYSNRHMHYTFQGYVYAGNDFASAAAIDSGNGPQRYYSNQGAYNTYGTIIRFGFSSMSATHPVVHMDLSYGAAGGDSLAEITNMSWS